MNNSFNVNIGNARIAFRNFAGEEHKFNKAGDRNFCVLLDYDIADELVARGFNVKELPAREDGDQPQPYLQVKVEYKNFPPTIYLITSRKKTLLTEQTINLLDYADIINVDLVIRPYNWEVNGKTGVKAYAKAMYVTIQEDAFESKYADIKSGTSTCVGPDCPVE